MEAQGAQQSQPQVQSEGSPVPKTLSTEQRQTYAALADVLIPEGSGMPSGGKVALDRGGLDAVLRVRHDLFEPLTRVLDAAEGRDPQAEIKRLQAEDEEGFATLSTLVAGGYFLDDEVREALGYKGQQAIPIPERTTPDYEEDGLIQSVIDRGPIYRPTPNA